MILKFDDFVKLYEGVESVVPLSSVRKLIEPYGWEYTRGSGDGCKFSKGNHVVYFHLKHDGSRDENRSLDVGGLDKLREYMIDDFRSSGDLTLIKLIPWEKWRVPSPFNRELKDIDPETGQRIEKPKELNIGHKLQMARMEKDRKKANEKYKDAILWKIDNKDEKSAYIICVETEKGNIIYNTCRGLNDRRPLHKQWMIRYIEKDDNLYLGRDIFNPITTRSYKVNADGSFDKTDFINESNEKIILETSLNESNISYNIDNDIITFYNNNERIGGLCFNVSNYDDIYSEYRDSVNDFDDSIMEKFNDNNPIVNIEDIWINRNFQGKGLFRNILTIGLNILDQKYNQFILRACSDNGFPEEKLVSIYGSFGFISYQETEQDGTIMFRKN